MKSVLATGFGDNADGARLGNPAFRCEREAIQASLFFNSIVFDGINNQDVNERLK